MNASPLPDPAVALYTGDPGREYHHGKRALRPEVLPWVMSLRAEKFQPHVQPEDTVFEFGVGSGWNLGKLRCARRIGFDAAGFLRERVQALDIEFVTEFPRAPAGIADVVICHQTLEHVLSPSECLRDLFATLKPGGKLVLHVPWEREKRYGRYRPEEPNHHLYNWNAQNLGNLVTVLGFRVLSVDVRTYGYDRFAANAAFRLGIGEGGFRLLRKTMVLLRPFWEVELIASRPV